jgi:hypothetical protein
MVSHPQKQQFWQEIDNNPAFNTFLQKWPSQCWNRIPTYYEASERYRSLTFSVVHCNAETSRACYWHREAMNQDQYLNNDIKSITSVTKPGVQHHESLWHDAETNFFLLTISNTISLAQFTCCQLVTPLRHEVVSLNTNDVTRTIFLQLSCCLYGKLTTPNCE